jgi:hypothetical protein
VKWVVFFYFHFKLSVSNNILKSWLFYMSFISSSSVIFAHIFHSSSVISSSVILHLWSLYLWSLHLWFFICDLFICVSSSVPLSFIHGSVHYTENIKGIRTWKMPYGINNNIFHGANKLQEKTHWHSVTGPSKLKIFNEICTC